MPSLSPSKDALPANCGYNCATDTTNSLAGSCLQVSSTASIKTEKKKPKKKSKQTKKENTWGKKVSRIECDQSSEIQFLLSCIKKRPFVSTDCKDKSVVSGNQLVQSEA